MKKNISVTLLMLFFAFAGNSQRYFIKFEGGIATSGDSEDATFNKSAKWSEIYLLDFEVETPVSINHTSQTQVGQPQTGMISFTKPYFSGLSNPISQALVTGVHYDKIIIIGAKQNSNMELKPFVRYEFGTALFGNIKKGNSNAENADPIETYLFKAGTFTVFNFNYANPDMTGTLTCKSYGWNFVTNTEIITTTTCPAIN